MISSVPARVPAYLLGLALITAIAGCGGSAVPLDSDPVAADQMAIARQMYLKKDYRGAEELLKGYLDYNPAGEDAGEAHYLLGQIYLDRKQWPSAETEFSIVVNQFGADARAPDALYYRGLARWEQSRPWQYDQIETARALEDFDRFLSLYPDHPRAEDVLEDRNEARTRLARKDFENGKLSLRMSWFRAAQYYYRKVQREFPDTDWAEEAKLGEAKTYFKQKQWYRARDVLESLLVEEPSKDVERDAKRMLDDITQQLAESKLDQAESLVEQERWLEAQGVLQELLASAPGKDYEKEAQKLLDRVERELATARSDTKE